MYNETPLDRGWGTPLELWRVGRESWDCLIYRAKKERDRANVRQKGRICWHPWSIGEKVWIWDMKKEGNLGDKLAPIWVGLAKLVK